MIRKPFFPLALVMVLMTITLVSCDNEEKMPQIKMPGMTPNAIFTALAEGNQLFYFQDGNLNEPAQMLSISGLGSGEAIFSIEYRPATGQLYGLSSGSRLYTVNEKSGVATPLGMGPFSPAIEGNFASLDFNPTVDRIRLVAGSGENLKLHQETGAVVATDGRINAGMNPSIGAVAYSSSTILFDILFKAIPRCIRE